MRQAIRRQRRIVASAILVSSIKHLVLYARSSKEVRLLHITDRSRSRSCRSCRSCTVHPVSAVMRCHEGIVYGEYGSNSGKILLDYADHTAPTQQHALDRTDLPCRIYIITGRSVNCPTYGNNLPVIHVGSILGGDL